MFLSAWAYAEDVGKLSRDAQAIAEKYAREKLTWSMESGRRRGPDRDVDRIAAAVAAILQKPSSTVIEKHEAALALRPLAGVGISLGPAVPALEAEYATFRKKPGMLSPEEAKYKRLLGELLGPK